MECLLFTVRGISRHRSLLGHSSSSVYVCDQCGEVRLFMYIHSFMDSISYAATLR